MCEKDRDCNFCKYIDTDCNEFPCCECENSSEFELYKYKKEKIMAEDSCVCCGDIIPEGHQVCKNCEVGHLTDFNKLHKEKRKFKKWLLDLFFK